MNLKKISVLSISTILFTNSFINPLSFPNTIYANIAIKSSQISNENASDIATDFDSSAPTESKAEDFVIQDGILTKYTGDASIIIVPDNVTEIAANAFQSVHSDTIELYLPDNVQKIADRAFQNYLGRKITGGEGVKEIGRRAFFCSDAEIPDFPNAEKIAQEAFYLISSKNDEKLKELRIRKPEAFSPIISKEEEFIIADGVLKKYKGNASIINIPEGVTTIGSYVFQVSNIWEAFYPIEIHLPTTVSKISLGAFKNSGIQTITGTENIKEIEKRAFYHSAIESIHLPNVEIIGEEAFCFSLLKEISGLGKVTCSHHFKKWGLLAQGY